MLSILNHGTVPRNPRNHLTHLIALRPPRRLRLRCESPHCFEPALRRSAPQALRRIVGIGFAAVTDGAWEIVWKHCRTVFPGERPRPRNMRNLDGSSANARRPPY